jgi:hypothetical protein
MKELSFITNQLVMEMHLVMTLLNLLIIFKYLFNDILENYLFIQWYFRIYLFNNPLEILMFSDF